MLVTRFGIVMLSKEVQSLNVDMPITNAIYSILHSNLNPNEVVINLMMRNKTHEMEEIVNDKLGF